MAMQKRHFAAPKCSPSPRKFPADAHVHYSALLLRILLMRASCDATAAISLRSNTFCLVLHSILKLVNLLNGTVYKLQFGTIFIKCKEVE